VPRARALDVETTLNKAQIGCSRVFGVEDQYHDEHYRARDMTVLSSITNLGGRSVCTAWCRRCRSLPAGSGAGRSIGEDTSDILSKMLGLSEPQIASLYDDHVVHRTEPFTTAQVEPAHP